MNRWQTKPDLSALKEKVGGLRTVQQRIQEQAASLREQAAALRAAVEKARPQGEEKDGHVGTP
jgi:septal ring factor EnvC (AmiA/AmiB activator)